MNVVTRIFWNYINAGKDRFYVEDPRIPFVNGFTLILLVILVPFGMHRIFSGDLIPGIANLLCAVFLLASALYLRKRLNVVVASFNLSAITILIATYVFYEGATGGDTGILWIFPIPTLIFFLSGKRSAASWSIILALLITAIGSLFLFGYVDSPYTTSQLLVALFPFFSIVAGLYMYATFTEWNAQELEERTKVLREGFEHEKEVIKVEGQRREGELRHELESFYNLTDELVGVANIQGNLIQVNPAFVKTFGYSREEIFKLPPLGLTAPDEIGKTMESMKQVMTEGSISNFVSKNLTKDGRPIWVMWNAVYHDNIIYLTGRVVNDMIEAKEKLETRARELEELNKLMVGREIRMTELKEEISGLKQRLGEQ